MSARLRRYHIALMAGTIPAIVVFTAPAFPADEHGRALFDPCRACHALDPAATGMAGPNLAGLIGRKLGGDPAFDYSPVLRQAAATGSTWTLERLERFLADPEAMFPGMWMSSRRIDDPAERKALAEFLADPTSR